MATDPWAEFNPQSAAGPSRPVIRKAPDPVKPDLPEGWRLNPQTGQAERVPGLPSGFTEPKPTGDNLPQGYRMGPGGVAERIPGLPPASADPKVQEGERNAAFLGTRVAGGIQDIQNVLKEHPSAAKPGWLASIVGIFGDEARNWANDPARRQVEAAQMDVLDAALTLGTGAAYTKEQLDAYRQAYFPKLTDDAKTVEAKQDRLVRLLESAKVKAGSAAPQIDAVIQSLGGTQEADKITESSELIGTPGPGTIQSSTGTKTVTDEKLKAIAGKVGMMVTRGLPRANIAMFMSKNGVNPAETSIDQILAQRGNPTSDVAKWIRTNPDKPYPIHPDYEVPIEGAEKLGAEISASAPGAATMNFIDAISANNLGNVTEAMGAPEGSADMALALSGNDHPYASLGGRMGGGITAALGGEALLARAGMAPGMLRALIADTGYGGAAGASNADNGNYLAEGAEGALKALAGSLTGQGLMRGTAGVLGGVRNPSVRAVADEGVPMTLGQSVGQSGIAGRAVKGVEDRLAGIPVVGDVINARQLEGVQTMNAKAFNKALEPIGVNASGKIGEEAVEEAQTLVGDAFTTALAGKAATVDRPFLTQAAAAKNAIQKLPRVGAEVESSIDEVVKSYFDPQTLGLSGENMQGLLRDLGNIKRAYASDPMGHRVGKAVEQLESAVEGLFRRQAPEVMPQYNAAKQAFRRLSIVEDAVLRAKNTGGVFTPAQLGMADRANAKKFSGSHAAAAGKGEFHDFQRAMQDVLPNKVPDSGTAGRLIVPAAIVGAGATGGAAAGDTQSGTATGLTLAALLAAAYSRTGQRAMTGLAAKRGPKARAIADQTRKLGRITGAGGAALAAPHD